MNLLYVGLQNRMGFTRALADKWHTGYAFTSDATRIYEHLQGADGVVFIGGQKKIFGSDYGYFTFLGEVHKQQKHIAAVLYPGESLPRQNEGIDKVIESTKGERTIGSLARELYLFFSSDH